MIGAAKMFGIVIFGHEEFCSAMQQEAELIAEGYSLSLDNLATITVDPGERAAVRTNILQRRLKEFESVTQVLILVNRVKPTRTLFDPNAIVTHDIRVLGSCNSRMLQTAMKLRDDNDIAYVCHEILSDEARVHLAPDLDISWLEIPSFTV